MKFLNQQKIPISSKTGDDSRLLVVGSGSGVVEEWDMERKKWAQVFFFSWNPRIKKNIDFA